MRSCHLLFHYDSLPETLDSQARQSHSRRCSEVPGSALFRDARVFGKISAVTTMDTNSESARERLRALHRVRPVTNAEEGTAAGALPPGVYGFTGSPGLAAPLFAVRRYRNFEIHHLSSGVAIVGFVSPADAARLREATNLVDVTIYPDIEQSATEIVAITYARIGEHRQYSVRNTPGFALKVRPQPELAAV